MNDMTAATKTVQGHFGPKQMTRADYVKRWTETVSDAFWLTTNTAEHEEVKAMQKRIGEMAGRAWDAIK